MSVSDQHDEASLASLMRGVVDCFVQDELAERLKLGRPLRVKAGFDPTAPDLHLGHTVLFKLLRRFQDLGHEVIVVVGDFTAMIGDPTGKNQTRPVLAEADVLANAETYQAQLFKVLDASKTRVMRNSLWLGQLDGKAMVELAQSSTVARMLAREDFAKRYREGQGIAIHEFLYPLLQAYDSVHLEADVELGGTDQTFNLLLGRELQKQHEQKPQVVMTVPLLEGLDGVQKMSKSAGNVVGVMDAPADMFGKIMSVSDDLMWRYFEVLDVLPASELTALQQAVADGANPRDAKIQLAKALVARFHDASQAELAAKAFVSRFQKGVLPEAMPALVLEAPEGGLMIGTALKAAGLVVSTSEAMRLLKQRAVKCDGEVIEDREHRLMAGTTVVCQVGKRRLARLVVRLAS